MSTASQASPENIKQKMAPPLDDIDFSATEFSWPVRVYWEDTDAGGIVFYANYLKFFERARTEWLRSLGLHQQALRDTTGGMFVVTDAQLKYHAPARLDDALRVTARVVESGKASLVLEQKAWLQPSASPQGARGNMNPLTHTVTHSASAQGTVGTPPVSAPGSLLCAGRIRIGWVNAASMRPQRIPESVLQALSISNTHDQ